MGHVILERQVQNQSLIPPQVQMAKLCYKDSLEINGDVNSAYNKFINIFTNMLNMLKKKNTKAKTKSINLIYYG